MHTKVFYSYTCKHVFFMRFLPFSSIPLSFTRRQTINWFLYTIFGANTCIENGILGYLSSKNITQWPKKGLEGFLLKKFCIAQKCLWGTKMQLQHLKISSGYNLILVMLWLSKKCLIGNKVHVNHFTLRNKFYTCFIWYFCYIWSFLS